MRIMTGIILIVLFQGMIVAQINDEPNLTQSDLNKKISLEKHLKRQGLSKEEIKKIIEERNKLENGFEEELNQPIENENKNKKELVSNVKEYEKYFGYDIFNYSADSFEPYDFGAVDSEYPVGPYDELLLYLWGDVELRHKLTVNRHGKLFIPNVGAVYVNGLSLSEAKKKIESRLGEVYSGLNKHKVFVDLSLGKLRKIKVFIMGNTRKPGGYTLSAVSNAFHSLYYAGGPSLNGSLRSIQIKRNGKIISEIDLYDYLLRGDDKDDVSLRNGDIIFVPYVKKRVGIKGGVLKPAIYELKEDEGLKELINFAGGLGPEAYSGSVQIKRIKKNSGTVLLDCPLEEMMNGEREVELHDGDTVMVNRIFRRPDNYVTISGEVLLSGNYEYTEGTTVNDLIEKAGGILKSSYKLSLEVSRVNFEVASDSLMVYNIKRKGGRFEDFELAPYDIVYVRKDPNFLMQKKVKINGEVNFPGEYSLVNEKEALSGLIERAGGMKKTAFPEGIRFFRKEVGKIDVNVNSGKWEEDIVLRDNDSIYIPKVPATVKVYGEVLFPTNLKYEPDKKLKDYIARAGGFTDQANSKKVVVTMANGRVLEQGKFLWFKQDIPISPGAMIFVPTKAEKKTDWKETIQKITSVISSVAMTIFLVQNIDK